MYSKIHIIFNSTDINGTVSLMFKEIKKEIENFVTSGSGWDFNGILDFDLSFHKYKPLAGHSYSPLPKFLELKNAIINVKNYDNECFKWAVTSAIYPNKNSHNYLGNYMRESSKKFNWDEITFPTPIDQIPKFGKNNNISIAVFGYDEDEGIFPLGKNEFPKSEDKHINLLLLNTEKDNNVNPHYCWIKNFSRLCSSQVDKSGNNKLIFCIKCLSSFYSQKSLEAHQEYCSTNDCVAIKMPEKDSFIKFKNIEKQITHPAVFYADFECFLKPAEEEIQEGEKTTILNEHIPSGFCLKLVCKEGIDYPQDPIVFSATSPDIDVAQVFVEIVEREVKKFCKKFDWPIPIKFKNRRKRKI